MNGIKTQCYIEEYKKGDGVSCRLREKVTNRIIIMEGDPDEHFSTFVSKTRDISDFLSDRDDYFDSNITESYIHVSGPIIEENEREIKILNDDRASYFMI